jgi:16S rRNA (uracil1498-N3)-methyltransferase
MKNLPERHIWRFFVTQDLAVGSELELSEGEAHFASVLRIRSGETVELTNGAGSLGLATVVSSERNRVRVRVEEQFFFERQLPLIELFVGVSKPAALEESVESAVQLGADSIRFVDTAKSQKFRSGSSNANERIQKIARESCRLSKRPWFCDVASEVWSLERVVDTGLNAIFVCDEAPLHDLYHSAAGSPGSARHSTLFHELTQLAAAQRNGQKLERIALVVGPESGFTNQEKVALQDSANAKSVPLVFVSLGDRILTVPNAVRAAVTLAAAVSYIQKSLVK